MVFTYYRIYVIANQQTKNLKLGVKQIEIGCESNSTEYPNSGTGGPGGGPGGVTGFALRIHRGGYNRASTESELPHKCYNNLSETTPIASIEKSFASIQHQQNQNHRGNAATAGAGAAHNQHRTCSNTFSDPTTISTNTNRFINQAKSSSSSVPNSQTVQSSSNVPNSKVHWSVGRRLAKLAKGNVYFSAIFLLGSLLFFCFFLSSFFVFFCFQLS